jgi:arylsulfatase A-like enzyme
MSSHHASNTGTTGKPNIIILYADDLGYGDLGCYGATDIQTPNLDRLAAQGITFTEGYSTAATCTPARYSLLTGSYPWRNNNAAILAGDASLIIDPAAPTMPGMLRQEGYTTGVVGKWHLGLGSRGLDWNKEIEAGPLDVGFDYSFIMPATNDRVPCVFVDGRKVAGLDADDPIEVSYGPSSPYPEVPTGRNNPELLRMGFSHGHDGTIVNGVSRIGYMRGGTAALWKDEEMAELFVNKAVSFITDHANEPFFLFYAFHQPHVPRLPGPRFAGSTKLGPRGDVIVEMDWCVGEVLDSLERLGLRENTIVMFSSDNGPVLNDGYADQSDVLTGAHKPAGPLRGGKYSKFEGGTRLPFILSWPGTVEPGRSSAFVSQVDLYASIAEIVGHELESAAAPDSFAVAPALLGRSAEGRSELVTEGNRNTTVLRRGDWVYIPPYPGQAVNPHTRIETGSSPTVQLYNIKDDIGQQINRAEEQPAKAAEMAARLQEIIGSVGTRPGYLKP